MEKTFDQMNNRELFAVLAGDQGIMPQMHLQKVGKEYLASHTEDADMMTMVRWAVENEK